MSEHVTSASSDTLAALRRASIARQVEWSGGALEPLPILFKATELGGEAGEVLNVVKKLERERLGWVGSRATVEQLADELADLVICADLLAEPYGIDLPAAIVRKFNATSEQRGLSTRMGRSSPADKLADLVARFSAALLDKLRDAEAKYGHGDAWARPGWREDLRRQLAEHIAKGDPRDVAAYAAFAWHHGWSVSGASNGPVGKPSGSPWGWRRVSDAPEVGGLYLFGGYVSDGVLPRRFERGFVHLIRTVDGSEWTIRDPQYQHIPIEWWTEAGGPHPEYAASAGSSPRWRTSSAARSMSRSGGQSCRWLGLRRTRPKATRSSSIAARTASCGPAKSASSKMAASCASQWRATVAEDRTAPPLDELAVRQIVADVDRITTGRRRVDIAQAMLRIVAHEIASNAASPAAAKRHGQIVAKQLKAAVREKYGERQRRGGAP